ncbi:MAG: Gfo/Idh/MocA family oxidoreductase [Butyrivibrio sp.]|nr:Gfo/Idh/MocA family oxidoreductase [Butyrivibrio sp.]
MYNIGVIGVGSLGKRHLESLCNSKLELNIYCYDINEHALDDFESKSKYNIYISIIKSFSQLPKVMDFVIFAMTSKGRREVFDQLLANCYVKNILFEKVLFQKIEDYEHVNQRLNELNIKAWVNCSRRQMDSYQDLRKRLEHAKEMRIAISGGEWGLACNAIHEIDLVEFLSGSRETFIENMSLLPVVAESKRHGYKEVYGSLEGRSGKCSYFSISCMKDTQVPCIVTISTDVGHYIIFENEQKMVYMEKDSGYTRKEQDFIIPYQSQMSQYVMEDILLNGDCRLAEYDVSKRLHLEFIKPLIKFFNDNGWENQSCPIT